MAKKKSDTVTCEWIDQREAFKRFATHIGGTQRAKHIKHLLHWYIASRLVLEGGFDPEMITPRPPFVATRRKSKNKIVKSLIYEPRVAEGGEKVILGGLKTKSVDVVVTKNDLGPVIAISCKGVTEGISEYLNRSGRNHWRVHEPSHYLPCIDCRIFCDSACKQDDF